VSVVAVFLTKETRNIRRKRGLVSLWQLWISHVLLRDRTSGLC